MQIITVLYLHTVNVNSTAILQKRLYIQLLHVNLLQGMYVPNLPLYVYEIMCALRASKSMSKVCTVHQVTVYIVHNRKMVHAK